MSSTLIRSSWLLCLLSLPLTAQTPAATVPAQPNASCPIMGKKVSASLFVDTELGRVWVCCKPCFKKVLADVPTAHRTAFPVVQETKNTHCPVSGTELGEQAVAIVLQNRRFRVCCSACAERAKSDAQPTLAKLAEPTLREVGNDTCPVRGTPVVANHFVVIDGQLVRLADAKASEAAKQDAAATLAKAQALAKAQPPKPKHEPKPPAKTGDAKPPAAKTEERR